MQRHVSALYALGGKGAKRTQVLRQTDGDGDLAELLRRCDPENLQGKPRQRMRPGGTAHQADRHRQFDAADQGADAILLPARERCVRAAAAGISMGPGLDRPPIVAGGNDHRVDAVHDPLVVGGGAIGVDGGQRVGVEDRFDDFRAAAPAGRQRVWRDPHPGTRKPQVRQVREDPQADRAAGDALDERRHGFGHGVDGVGAHRVAHVDDQVHHDHGAAGRIGKHVYLDVAAAAAQPDQDLVPFVRHGKNRLTLPQECLAGAMRVGDPEHLHLRPHQRQAAGGLEAATPARQPGHERSGRDHGRFLHHHRHQDIFSVDGEVGGDAEWEFERADDVLDHAVRPFEGQRAGSCQLRDVGGVEADRSRQLFEAPRRREGAEIGQTRVDGHGVRYRFSR